MGKRGPKPVDMGLLNSWEFEFYKAFHVLRDGVPLPESASAWSLNILPSELRKMIQQLTRMTWQEFWLTSRRMLKNAGENVDLRKPPSRVDQWWAEAERAQQLFRLKRAVQPLRIQAQARRHKIWKDLCKSKTYAELRKACGRWARLPDVRWEGMTPFPEHVLSNAA